MKRIFVFVVMLLILTNVFCQENVLFSDNGSIAFQNQDYMLQVILVNDLKATLDIWNVPNVTPNITKTTKVKIDEPLSLFIVYATDKDNINLTYNLKIKNPDGTFSNNAYNGLKISDKVIQKRVLYTAAQMPTITLDKKEEIGKHQFIVEVYDSNEIIIIFILEYNLLE